MVQITAATLTQGPVCLRHRRSISHKLNKKDSNKDITPSPFSATNNHTGVVVNHELWSDRHWPGSGRPDVTGTGRAQDTTDSEQKGTLQPRERESLKQGSITSALRKKPRRSVSAGGNRNVGSWWHSHTGRTPACGGVCLCVSAIVICMCGGAERS